MILQQFVPLKKSAGGAGLQGAKKKNEMKEMKVARGEKYM